MEYDVIGGFWGVSPDSIWAGSDWGLLHWDGKAWNEVSSDTSTSHLGSVWASGDDDVWAIGGNIVGHWDGNVWRTSRVQTPLYYGWTKNLFGTAQGRVWIIGSAGTVARKKP